MQKSLPDIDILDVLDDARTPALGMLVILLAILVFLMVLGIIIVLARLVMG